MARGYNSIADVRTLGDGTDMSTVWAEFSQALDLANAQRGALLDLLTFRTTNKADLVLQAPGGTAEFEDASEYGVPSGSRAEAATVELGYPFVWKDFATRFTWQFLADASVEQVTALHNGAIAADYRLMTRTVLEALFSNTNRTHASTDSPIRALWNGDGSAIPDYNGETFGSTHNHYGTTESATLAPSDVEWLQSTVLEHGYGEDDGAQLVILAGRDLADTIAGWRAGVNGAAFDYIPSETAVPYLTTEQLVGQRPGGQFQGMKIVGQYGNALIAPTSLVPRNYLTCVAVGGSTPVIGLREHRRLTGLQIVRGSQPDYPLLDSYYVHGLGAGVRQRGGAACLQVTTSATYTSPSFA
ncbi:hypothetical protein [uncultured Nocardioides sp.]|uniref:hypothetical protein n=1 Tax=uncultured Nocardioides sp. TaxID=198441 RepID=UPI00263600AD|nr:hypothetical protein [uncultured Nocardioides sp.]